MALVREWRPQQCTFVPDSAEQSTSDHGWDLRADAARLRPLIAELQSLGVRVSLFMDPVPEAMALARELGADRVELYTETYARAHGTPAQGERLAAYARTAEAALAVGLGLNAGHDLNRDNLADFLRAVPGVQEVSIGHALIADALELGIAETVRALPALHPPGPGRRMIYGIGTDICDIRRIAATLERRGERFAEKVLGPHELEVFRARGARVAAARPELPGHALLGQGGLLQGHRPGHAHADDLARLRDRQRGQRQARDPTERRAGRVVRRARPARPCQRHRRNRLRGDLRGRRTRGDRPMIAHAPVVLDIAGTTLTADDRRRLKHPLTGGLILFARNWVDRRQLTELTAEIKRERPDLLICVDHEGGRVQRFRTDGFTHLPPMRALGELWMKDALAATDAATACGYVLARRAARLRRGLQLHAGARPRPRRQRRHRRPRLPPRRARGHAAGQEPDARPAAGRHGQLRQALPGPRLRQGRQPRGGAGGQALAEGHPRRRRAALRVA